MTNGGELFKLARERRASEDQILDSVRESVLAELEGLAQEARQFVQQFEARIAAIVARAKGLVDSGEKPVQIAGLEPGGRLPQGASLTDMHALEAQLNAIVEGGRPPRPDDVRMIAERQQRPEIIAVRDGRD